ncbi:RNA polymerase sigma factor [Marinomonas mediterranea]|jgi:RNA polymerase sigma factor, sigma-70 family|uniref:RNA polymerase sigma factor n=1 Tax=Marinomonas mediterranea (strain ATCC 700492 / JCM 21426 / NBRC 103028 / MMB-1) TaxID=717774 RepID=F2JTC4_MARM1|nr:RNA polymerase sigma factor [Marinomonas mediterranea]ADZ90342.1 RNA polymerase, sigma-24 subunit, ECF subfamily [Marinomonas mediterranea MMB-1]WCN08398.1 sigma-70 family RNA polymerase sigma factor [Marinomonas mediterranea]WCN12454.1 sigma-70 family RNA polymerase sigma factor [Marinomonas mediterranea]WCN16526.1 sigma-70 family RNA polymerase sigma factor [Marinomonas mediterranea MMB-1]
MDTLNSFEKNNQNNKIDIAHLHSNQNEKLRRFISKKIWHKEDAEEVLQFTYLEAIRCQHKFIGDSKPETWLFGIAANLTKNYFKRYYNAPELEEMTESLIMDLESEIEADPAMLVEHENLLTKTVDAMSQLPSDTQSILDMVIEKDFSYQEAADSIGVPIGTIRSRLSRARQLLKQCIA